MKNVVTSRFTYRTQYSDDLVEQEIADATAIHCQDESLTVQDAPDSDINVLLARFGLHDGSVLPTSLGHINPSYYGDYTQQAMTLSDAADQIRTIDERFMALPATLRAEFQNDPRQLYNWVMDPRNEDEAIAKGLLSRVDADGKPIAPPTSQTVGTAPASGTNTPST